ncbi:PDZ domain-containing protein [Niabella sp. CC-SYL272]|uniref:S41 family peptidase n=1 Tax=Niabella agricola TaxID=2891571 RepID=UPI001F44F494|nr:S41 family peptidase [Niabella agricola]MCF3107755.1 PDZ domain-containing protein [Niabella agricola]
MYFSKRLTAATICLLTLTACPSKKDMIPPVKTGISPELLADSLFLYAKQIYYWNNTLPGTGSFNPRQLVSPDTITGLNDEMFAISRFATNPATGFSYEQKISYNSAGNPVNDNSECKFSYIIKTSDAYSGGLSFTAANNIRAEDIKMTLDGKENSLGFILGYMPVSEATTPQNPIPYTNKDSLVGLVRYVTKGSPAYQAGLRRGDIISRINGNSWRLETDQSRINAAFNASSITVTVYNPATASGRDVAVQKTLYTFNPVFRDTTLDIGGKKIGYIAFQSFTDLGNAQPALDDAFGRFGNITDIVVDLRYNGGGLVKTAAYLGNLLAPANANNQVLFAEYYNQIMQNRQATLLKNQQVYDANNVLKGYTYFDVDYSVAENTTFINKKGPFNSNSTIKNLYFIVSSATASASELLINSLKPYFDNVYLIGAVFSDNGKKTYGKPVGFFEIRLGNYSVYMANFETKNKNQINGSQTGSYYDGLSTNLQVLDDLRYDFGNPNEACFKYAIRKITGNDNYTPTLLSMARTTETQPATSAGAFRPVGRSIGQVTAIHDMIVTADQKTRRY